MSDDSAGLACATPGAVTGDGMAVAVDVGTAVTIVSVASVAMAVATRAGPVAGSAEGGAALGSPAAKAEQALAVKMNARPTTE